MTMEGTTEKDCSPLWSLYQQIVSDLKNHAPMWEEFISKASKLHSALKSALMAIAAFLDSFQKIADAATNARGATKEIGTALTRVCLRHRAIETRMKTFISALMDTLITPLSDRADEWRRGALCGALSREHARDVKRARAELRRRTLDVHRSARKPRRPAPDAKRRADVCLQDLQERKQQLEEMEERAVKAALVEERSRFCHFVSLLNPVVECEVAMLAEVGHLQEGAEQLVRHTAEPRTLPPASLQVICDIKTASAAWCDTETSSPPASRLGSRKSSLTSICSGHSQCSGELHGSTVSCSTPISSASSAGTLPANNESHCLSQSGARLLGRSADSGFRSQDLYGRGSDNQSISSECAPPAGLDDARDGLGNAASATWPDLKDTAQFERAASAIMGGRPHTISAAYERGHPRPALSVHTFTSEQEVSGALTPREGIYARPPLPTRCSSLERPAVPAKASSAVQGNTHHEFKAKPSSLPPHLTKEMPQAVYVNMSELATLAASRAQQQQQQQQAQQQQQHAASEHPHQEKVCSESSASESSLESSSGYGSQGAFAAEDHQHHQMQTHPEVEIVTLRRECESIAAARDSFSVSLGSLEEAVRSLDEATEPPAFATIGKKPAVPKRRPLSMTGVTAAAWSRRGSSSSLGKPPPPVRRSSSISRPQRPPQPGTPQSPLQPHDPDNLPPPPAFLLQPDGDAITAHQNSVAETIKQLTEIKHMPASPGVVRRGLQQFQSQSNQCQSPTQLSTFQKSFSPHGSVNPIYGAGGRLLESALGARKNSLNASASDLFRDGGGNPAGTPPGAGPAFSSFGPRGTDSHYGQTGFKIQQDKKYGQTGIYAQPAALAGQSGPPGPGGPMAGQGGPMAGHCGTRNPLSPLALRKNIAARSHSADRHGEQGSLIAALSAKLAPPSPRAARRPSAGSGLGDSPPKGKGTVPSTVQPSFLDKLAATLQQRGRPPRAVAVRDAINKHAQPDPRVCHTSLMEQIKRGATLRRNNHCNDRSAPKIR